MGQKKNDSELSVEWPFRIRWWSVVETSPSSTGAAGSIPGQGPHALWLKHQSIKQKATLSTGSQELDTC